LVQAGRPEEAVAEYKAALRLRADDARAHYNLGYALLSARRLPEARQEFEAALGLDPGLTVARDALRQLSGSP